VLTLPTSTTITKTTSGDLQGTLDGGVVAFRGVPYARPPVGPLRFAPSERPGSWTGARDAGAFGPAAMQATNAILGKQLVAAMSEDCLFLNVWTPAVDDDRRPVLVWLHGGAFVTGAGSSYDGAVLARRGDMVVVTVNYRLGLFGYLRGVDICGEALPSTGNEGLLDQLAALTWVNQEIAAFGGDADNTACGALVPDCGSMLRNRTASSPSWHLSCCRHTSAMSSRAASTGGVIGWTTSVS